LLRLHRQLLATCCEPDRHPERAAWQARIVELLGAGVWPYAPQQSIRLAEGVEMTFSFIPPGAFLMGSPTEEVRRGENETQHRVTLTQGFFLGVHPVTQAQWQAVMGNNPSHFKGENLPVEHVSWEDSLGFCRILGERGGKRYRLPTEAEREYACRAGTTTPFPAGKTVSTEQANFEGTYPYGVGERGVYREKTTPVGSFPCNPWGLFDMTGNVWEWCADWYGVYPSTAPNDPQGSSTGTMRVLRGGSWYDGLRGCRSAYRNFCEPSQRLYHYGCRVVLCLD
jgi:formylglycine-generating enzyme required for sulfatase activity